MSLNTTTVALAAVAGGVAIAVVGAVVAARTPWRSLGLALALIGLGFAPSNLVTPDDPNHDVLLFLRAVMMAAAATLFFSASDHVPVRATRPSRLHVGLFAAACIVPIVVLLRMDVDAASAANSVGVTLVEMAVLAAGVRFLQRRCDEPVVGSPLRLLGLGCFVAIAFGLGADVAYGDAFEWARTGAALLFVVAAASYRAPVPACVALILGVEGWASRLYLGDAHTYVVGITRGFGLALFVLGLFMFQLQAARERLARQASNTT